MKPPWAIDIRDQCLNADVPFFFKQWGGINKKKNGRKLDGRMWNQKPRKDRGDYMKEVTVGQCT
jgi:protein gp37